MKRWTLDEIFEDDVQGLLDKKPEPTAPPRQDDDRLIESFLEINDYIDKNGCEPGEAKGGSKISAMRLAAQLEGIRANEQSKRQLKMMDRHNLLGDVEPLEPEVSLDDLLEDDDLGLLDLKESETNTSILDVSKLPDQSILSRAKSDFIAKREPIPEEEFAPYEVLFKRVHEELKSGARKLVDFRNSEKNVQEGCFYLSSGLLCYLERSDAEKVLVDNPSGSRMRVDGRLRVIFENATQSNMLFRSFGKILLQDGKIVTEPDSAIRPSTPLGVYQSDSSATNVVSEEDRAVGWIYVLRTKHPKLVEMPSLYKIGVTTKSVEDRIAHAIEEATYLYSEVEVVATYQCYNLVANKFEGLLHRFFAEACLDVELRGPRGERIEPREWFVVPLKEIDQAIQLAMNGSLPQYRYDNESKKIIRK